ncbi:aminopeptidase P family protein [Phytoactinopolyspora limicola]|uniref:aminopeptidase P family protein n=1 Tax=Phytoactinopolyspora limicola TaxID=2715536 RepID=UPI00140A65A4|nr:aminopeptidase P family protein [Phytoactinopolyspora limicola]
MTEAPSVRAHEPNLPPALMEFMRDGWSDAAADAGAPPDDGQPVAHAQRRSAVSQAFPGETIVVPSGQEKTRSNGTTYPFRPSSNFAWLTGDYDPDGVLVFYPASGGHTAVLYSRGRSSRTNGEFFRDTQHGELWTGRRHSLAEKEELLQITTVDLTSLSTDLTRLTSSRARVLRGYDESVDQFLPPDLSAPVHDAALDQVLAELRLVKDDWELEQLQAAVDATVLGFEDVARALPADRPVSERLVDGLFAARARHDGNDVGYLSVVASGARATILHWARNNGQIVPGDLLLMDMGVENRHFYTADVTRTIPVTGRFTAIQRDLYEIVLTAQRAGIDAIRPGVAFAEIHQACMEVLAHGLDDLGVLPVSAEQALYKDSMLYWRWTLAPSGHMLGLDVHDCAQSRPSKYRDGILEEGYVLTVEPGLYFQDTDERVPEYLRGIGIRIEDDVLVTRGGATVLSSGLPTDPDYLESWLDDQRAAGPRIPGA